MFVKTTTIDWVFLLIYVLLTLMFASQAYINFIRKELSKFSYDAFSLFLAKLLGGRKFRQQEKKFSKDPKRIRLFGIFALFGVIGGIYEIANWINTFLVK